MHVMGQNENSICLVNMPSERPVNSTESTTVSLDFNQHTARHDLTNKAVMTDTDSYRETPHAELSSIPGPSPASADHRTCHVPETDRNHEATPVLSNLDDDEPSDWDFFYKVCSFKSIKPAFACEKVHQQGLTILVKF